VRQRFLSLTRRAIAGELDAWDAEPTRDLALLLHEQRPDASAAVTAAGCDGDQKLPAVTARSITIGAATCVFHKDRGILRVEVLP
jgi:uncharacterized protein (DUF924 family)